MEIQIKTPQWARPIFEKPYRYVGIKGGRGSGKSHFVAEYLIEDLILNPDHRGVCIREVQGSLKDSSKTLLEDKIQSLNVGCLFHITDTEIRRQGGDGKIIFKGMRDHNASTIKSLEGQNWAWVEEAQSLSKHSLDLLTPTIRTEGSQILFTWNPDHPQDAVDDFFINDPTDNKLLIHVNYDQNPFLPQTLLDEALACRERDPDACNHIWLGGYNEKSEARIFSKRWYIREFEIDHTYGQPNQGLDFGFSQDPTAAVRIYIKDECLYISHESGKIGLDLDDTPSFVENDIADFKRYPTYADSSRPESISYLKRHGWPRIQPCEKWPGSVEDGIAFMKSFKEIIIHPRCKNTINEFGLYSYKIDRNTGEITDIIIDKWNHYIDAIRYAIYKIIQRGRKLNYSKMIGSKTNLSS